MEVLILNSYLNIYGNNPTAGGNDGTIITEEGDLSSPLSFILDATENETKTATLAIRAESGFQTLGNTTISDLADTDDRWKLSLDNENWSDTIIFTDTILDTNLIFYAKASADSSESAFNDTTVTLAVSTKIIPV